MPSPAGKMSGGAGTGMANQGTVTAGSNTATSGAAGGSERLSSLPATDQPTSNNNNSSNASAVSASAAVPTSAQSGLKPGPAAAAGKVSNVSPPPREEPQLEPVNGVVQPPYIPPPHRPGRVTNQLQYLHNTVMKALWEHPSASYFQQPVDTKKLNLPDYYTNIMQPMDLGTIKRRLENNYYWSSKEFIQDINIMFSNCLIYHKPGEDVFVMAQTLVKFFRSKVTQMPKDEVVIEVATLKDPNGKQTRIPRAILVPGKGRPSSSVTSTSTAANNGPAVPQVSTSVPHLAPGQPAPVPVPPVSTATTTVPAHLAGTHNSLPQQVSSQASKVTSLPLNGKIIGTIILEEHDIEDVITIPPVICGKPFKSTVFVKNPESVAVEVRVVSFFPKDIRLLIEPRIFTVAPNCVFPMQVVWTPFQTGEWSFEISLVKKGGAPTRFKMALTSIEKQANSSTSSATTRPEAPAPTLQANKLKRYDDLKTLIKAMANLPMDKEQLALYRILLSTQSDNPFQRRIATSSSRYERDYVELINSLLRGPVELRSSRKSSKNEVELLWMQIRGTNKNIASTSKLNEIRYSHLLNKAKKKWYESGFDVVLSSIYSAVNANAFTLKELKSLCSDDGAKKKVLGLLLSFNSVYLRLGLEIIFDTHICLNTPFDVQGLAQFIWQRMLDSSKKYPEGENMKTMTDVQHCHHVTKKFLSILLVMDYLKTNRIITHDPCLFVKISDDKETCSILDQFCQLVLHDAPQSVEILRSMGYILSHAQTKLNEASCTEITKIDTDFRDGIKLMRFIEMLSGKQIMSHKLKEPLEKNYLYNVSLSLNYLKLEGCETNVEASDIVCGSKVKTFGLVWHILYKFQLPRMVTAATVIQKWWKSFRTKCSRHLLQKKRKAAANTIQRYFRGYRCRIKHQNKRLSQIREKLQLMTLRNREDEERKLQNEHEKVVHSTKQQQGMTAPDENPTSTLFEEAGLHPTHVLQPCSPSGHSHTIDDDDSSENTTSPSIESSVSELFTSQSSIFLELPSCGPFELATPGNHLDVSSMVDQSSIGTPVSLHAEVHHELQHSTPLLPNFNSTIISPPSLETWEHVTRNWWMEHTLDTSWYIKAISSKFPT